MALMMWLSPRLPVWADRPARRCGMISFLVLGCSFAISPSALVASAFEMGAKRGFRWPAGAGIRTTPTNQSLASATPRRDQMKKGRVMNLTWRRRGLNHETDEAGGRRRPLRSAIAPGGGERG